MRSLLYRLLRREAKSPSILVCMRQADTWTWPDHLGARTAGECADCGTPIFYEAQNAKYRKVCSVCAGLP